MAGKVSVTAVSPASASAARGVDAAVNRDPASTSTPSNGFSSAMNTAAQSSTGAQPNPTHDDAGGGQTDTPYTGGSNAPRGVSTDAKTKATQTAISPAGARILDEASTSAATVTASDASTLDSSAAIRNGRTPDKASGKTGSDNSSANSTASDPATLAMLLAASGLQPDAGTGPAPPADSVNDPTTSSDGNVASKVAAAGVVAANLFAISTGVDGQAASAIAGPASSAASTSAITAKPTSSASSHQADVAALIKLDSLADSDASADSSADATVLQTKSSAGDSSTAQATSSIGPNGLPELIRGMPSAAPQTYGAEHTIAIPVSDHDWSGAVAAQVQWQINSNVQSATLQLSPEHLGPLEVRIDMQSAHVNVSFTANHAETRAALEQSVPRLREILANSGLTLGQASVQQEARSGSQFTPPVSRVAADASQNVEATSVSSARAIGLIDEYA